MLSLVVLAEFKVVRGKLGATSESRRQRAQFVIPAYHYRSGSICHPGNKIYGNCNALVVLDKSVSASPRLLKSDVLDQRCTYNRLR